MSSGDPIGRLAKLRIVKLSADLEVQLSSKSGSAPALEILRRLQDRAAESLAALVFCNVYDPADRIKITTLQNEVKRYDEWLAWLKEIIAEGRMYDRELSDDDRQEMLDLLIGTPEGEKHAADLGLLERQQDDLS